VDQHHNSFQGVGYRKVTSGVNKGGMRVQTWRSKRRQKLEKVVSELLLPKPGGMCYHHNLAGPEGGP
jgi:hypothetical protein